MSMMRTKMSFFEVVGFCAFISRFLSRLVPSCIAVPLQMARRCRRGDRPTALKKKQVSGICAIRLVCLPLSTVANTETHHD